MTLLAAVVLVLVLPPIVFDVLRRPAIRRVGLRNLARRPGEAALVVLGSMLATALIVAAFIIGDSFGSSSRLHAETKLGPIDLLVPTQHLDRDVAALPTASTRPESAIESVLGVHEAELAVRGMGGQTEPRVRLWAIDSDRARTFGLDADAAGLTGLPSRLEPTDVTINERLASELGVSQGDSVELLLGRLTMRMRVAAVLPERGLAGHAQILVVGGAVRPIIDTHPDAVSALIAVSVVGDTYTGAARIPDAEREIMATMGGDTSIQPVKSTILDRADQITQQTTTRFVTVGGFTVAAAILLLVNLFVMLATERTVELGTMRAIGVHRGQTRRAFAVEGMAYGLLAAALGLVAGLALGALIVRVAESALGAQEGVAIRLDVEPVSVLSGGVIGLAVSQLTVLLTTMHIVRVNIVPALKGAVSPRSLGGSRYVTVVGVAVTASAVGMIAAAPDAPLALLAAPIAIAVGVMPLLNRWLGPTSVLLPAGAAMVWASSVFGIFQNVYEKADIKLFIVQGLALVGLTVAAVTVVNTQLVGRVQALPQRSVAARLGLITAFARPLRTALLTTMFALVIFTMTFTAVLNTVLGLEGPKDVARAGGGYGVLLASSRLSPVTSPELRSRDDVESELAWTDRYAMIASTALDIYEAKQVAQPRSAAIASGQVYPVRRKVTLVSADIAHAAPPVLAERSNSFISDVEAWAYVADHPSAIIVPKYVGLEIGSTVELVDPSGRRAPLRVIGLSDWNWLVGAGIYVSGRLAGAILPDSTPVERHFLAPAPGVSATDLAARLNTAYAPRGGQAQSISDEITVQNSETAKFITILQSYLALGMFVGIAGLTVALVRGARERRHQLGVLRALGFARSVLRNTLLVEVALVSVQGVVIGVGLGVLSAWQVLINSTAIARHLSFGVPWGFLVFLTIAALAAALLAAVVPATMASRIPPAESLRLPA